MNESVANHFSFSHLFKGSALYGSSDVITALVRFSLIAVYTRILAPADFGLYAVIQTTLTCGFLLFQAGLPSVLMLNTTEKNPLVWNKHKNAVFYSLGAISLLAGISLISTFFFLFPKNIVTALVPWLVLHGFSEIMGSAVKASLRIREKIAEFTIAKLVRTAIMVSLLYFLLHRHTSGLTAIIMAEAIAVFLEFMLCMFLDAYVPGKPSFTAIRAMLLIGLPLTVVGFGQFCIDLSDRYIIFSMMGNAAIGYYAAAGKIAMIASYTIEAFNSMWFPYYLRTTNAPGAVSLQLTSYAKNLALLFSLIISLFMLLLPMAVKLHWGNSYFIGNQYFGVAVLIAPLICAYLFKMVFYIASPIIMSAKKNWTLVLAVYVAAVVNILGNVVIITMTKGFNDVFFTLVLVALNTSVAYAICMLWTCKASGLFTLKTMLFSLETLVCIILLTTPLFPVWFVFKCSIILGCGIVVAKRFIKKKA